jgi:hypothetical protein
VVCHVPHFSSHFITCLVIHIIITPGMHPFLGTARYGYIDSFGKFKHGSTLVLSRISCTASGLALLEDEQKFKLGGALVLIKC